MPAMRRDKAVSRATMWILLAFRSRRVRTSAWQTRLVSRKRMHTMPDSGDTWHWLIFVGVPLAAALALAVLVALLTWMTT